MPMSTGTKWLTGCLVAFFVTLIIGIVILAVIGYKVKTTIDSVYSDKPAYQQYEPSAVEISNIDLKMDKIKKDFKDPEKEQLLSFTASEINTLISENDESGNNISVSINDNLILVEASIYNPEDNKYFNMAGNLSVNVVNGELQVFVEDAKLGDFNLPQNTEPNTSENNLADVFKENFPDLEKVEFLEVYIEDEKLWLRVKPKAN